MSKMFLLPTMRVLSQVVAVLDKSSCAASAALVFDFASSAFAFKIHSEHAPDYRIFLIRLGDLGYTKREDIHHGKRHTEPANTDPHTCAQQDPCGAALRGDTSIIS